MTALSGDLSFATVEAALAQGREALGRGEGLVEIDLAGVTRSDSAGLALLLELVRTARAGKREIRFAHPPAQLRQLAEFFGIAEILNLAA